MELSVCVTVYNNAPYLKQLATGLWLNWTQNMELIIVDDASTDQPDYSIFNQFSNFQLVVLSKNLGNVKAKNTAINKAEGKFITCHDGDDWSLAGRFQSQLNFLNSNDHVFCVGTGTLLTDVKQYVYRKNIFPYNHEDLLKSININSGLQLCPGTLMWRNVLGDKYMYRDFFNQKGAEDTDLIYRMISDGKVLMNLKGVYYYYRQHSYSVSHIKKVYYTTQIAYFLYQQRLAGEKDAIERGEEAEIELFVEDLKKNESPRDMKSVELADQWIKIYNCDSVKSFRKNYVESFKLFGLRSTFYIGSLRFFKMFFLKNYYYRFKYPVPKS